MRRISVLALVTFAFAAPASAASLPSSHGQLLHLVSAQRATANATQSANWIGYDQGGLEQGGKLFNSVSGEWTVPKAAAHVAGQAASSSDWIGIGGGCVDSGCRVTDATLIQTGTEQDVDSGGSATYSAWWEEIPGPSVPISNVNVRPGDRMSASIAEVVPNSNLWTITVQDLTNRQSFTTTVPYVSTHATAEWIEENPLVLGTTTSGFSTLPSLTTHAFDLATANGSPVKLATSEQLELVDSNGKVIGVPSAPDPEADGFNTCAWASTCPAPGSAQPAVRSPTTTRHRRTTKPRAKKRHTTATRHHKTHSRKRHNRSHQIR